MTGRSRLAIDVGGTFTDCILQTPNGVLTIEKTPTTVGQYEHAIMSSADQLLQTLTDGRATVDEVLHATTVGTNAILEGSGPIVGLITTHGFRDVLEIGRMRLHRLYDLTYEKVPPIVPRRLRRVVSERVGSQGNIVQPLDVAEVLREAAFLADAGVEAIAVAFINAWSNDAHERRAACAIRDAYPGIYVTSSSELLPEVGEYERTSTCVINAYLQPVMVQYLMKLANGLADLGHPAPVSVMQSSGGLISSARAATRPAQLVESGPAAGVVSGAAVARLLSIENCVTFDMGGTTAKAAAVESGAYVVTSDYEVGGGLAHWGGFLGGGGHTLRLPSIDIAEVGAGGGSIARIDAGGALKVGPESAGAMPGPACYGRGGASPTITDANVCLGYINPAYIAGGAISIDPDRAADAISAEIGRPLGFTVAEAAWAIHVVGNAAMLNAVKGVTIGRGRDPRDYVLMAFGGSGPVHAVGLARLLEMGTIIVPSFPGVFSSLGLLMAEHHAHRSAPLVARLDDSTISSLARSWDTLARQAREDLSGDSTPSSEVAIERSIDLRYVGQDYVLTVDVSSDWSDVAERAERAFEAEHRKTYGHAFNAAGIEVVNVRVKARSASASPTLTIGPRSDKRASQDRLAYFGSLGWVTTPVLARSAVPEELTSGPLIIEEDDATAVICPSCVVRRGAADSLVITVR